MKRPPPASVLLLVLIHSAPNANEWIVHASFLREMGATTGTEEEEQEDEERNDGAFQKTGTGHVAPLLCIK